MRDEFQALIADRAEALIFKKTQSVLLLVTGRTGDAIEGMEVSALLPENSPSDLLVWLADAYLGALAELSEPIITVPLVDLV
jgi:hypothetical protein